MGPARGRPRPAGDPQGGDGHMNQPPKLLSEASPADRCVSAVKRTLQLVCAGLPHLSGLAAAVRIFADERVATAGITQTGRLLVNPHWFTTLRRPEAVFVMAHELFHLCL